MSIGRSHPLKRIGIMSGVLFMVLATAILLGISLGSTGYSLEALTSALLGKPTADATIKTIIWEIRFPRTLLAALVGAALSLGGLVFQALLRNPLAEPYILGVSGGSAVGAIIGIILGFSRFPGVGLTAFVGSMATLFLVLILSSGSTLLKKDSLLLAGVMVNAFCSAVIIFLLSLAQHSKLHNIIFWLMGDLSMAGLGPVARLAVMLFPCFLVIFLLSHNMNVLLMGKASAASMGVNIRTTMLTLLITSSFMVSATVSLCGLLGFVGLVMPHLLRLALGPDHRVLVPACILGGGAFMVVCDILARILPKQGEMPVGVITAMLGAPLFIYLLKRNGRRSRYERR